MSLGGRPKEEGGHKRINVTLDVETHKGLKKIEKRGQARSKFIESAVGPLIRQLDPGESCETLHQIDCMLRCGIISAVSEQNFEKATTLTSIGNALEPFRSLCRPIKGDRIEKGNPDRKTCSCDTFPSRAEK